MVLVTYIILFKFGSYIIKDFEFQMVSEIYCYLMGFFSAIFVLYGNIFVFALKFVDIKAC